MRESEYMPNIILNLVHNRSNQVLKYDNSV